MNNYKYLISVDPGSKSAFAEFENGDLIGYGRVNNISAAMAYDLIKALCKSIETLVVIEGQWFRLPTIKNGQKQYHSANFARVIKIVESRCWYQAAAEIHGLDVKIIDPGKWIPAMTRGMTGDTADKRIKEAAKLRYPDRKLVADENAAVLLGDYVINLMNNGIDF